MRDLSLTFKNTPLAGSHEINGTERHKELILRGSNKLGGAGEVREEEEDREEERDWRNGCFFFFQSM